MAPYEKLKNEQYHNFGGINTKVSPYASGPEEFLNLINCDFQTPGSLQKRQGSTQFLTSGVSGRVTGLYEFESLSGASYVILGANTHLYYINSHTPTIITSGLQDSALFSFVTFVDRLFVANGANFFKWQAGGNAVNYSLIEPYVAYGTSPVTGPGTHFSGSTQRALGNTQLWTAGSSFLFFSLSYINDIGFVGAPNASQAATFQVSGLFQEFADPAKDSIYFNFGVTSAAGITYCPLISGDGTYVASVAQQNGDYGVQGLSYGLGFTLTSQVYGESGGSAIGSTTQTYHMAVFRTNGTQLSTGDKFLCHYLKAFSVNGSTFFADRVSATYCFGLHYDETYTTAEPSVIHFTLAPRYLEIFNNQLFMAGFSATPSTVWFSDIGEPESIQPDNNFEVRTNDGDVVTGLRAYLAQLVIFKQRSFHVLSGDDPTNFALREITDQYGCISGRAIATYQNIMMFLDQKGIVQYNGANYEIISNKIEPVFQRMNLAAARDNAVMIHNKARNQVWTGIPVDGATMNNLTVVYDYLLNAWTTFEGFNPSDMAMIKADQPFPTAFYGAYSSGSIYYFNSSFMSDNGTGFTFLVKTRFFADTGEATQKQFRRFYANVDQSGASSLLKLEFYQDYGASMVYSSTMSMQPFQSRIDYGISARALSVQITNYSAVDAVRLHGFTISHRFQRDV